MRSIFSVIIGLFCLVVFLSLHLPPDHTARVNPAVIYFKEKSVEFTSSAFQLRTALLSISSSQPESIIKARSALKNCRLNYKRIEFFLEYFFKSNALLFNGPAKYEVEEPYMEYQTPIGLQVIESLLFEKNVFAKRKELIEQADAIASSAKDIPSLLYGFEVTDQQLLESIRIELIRIYTLGITGFDAPFLKSGISESHAALEALAFAIKPYTATKTTHTDSVNKYLASALAFLKINKNFDSFDRLVFFKQHALSLQMHVGRLIKKCGLELNTTRNILNYDAENLFSPDAINVNAFPGATVDISVYLIELGKKLFNEKALSGNNKISCATCHQPQKHFTDALPKSIGFDGHSGVKRNAPTLLYAAFQYEQFWDGRAKSLPEQVMDVLHNPKEMNCNPIDETNPIKSDPQYLSLFSKAFPNERDSLVTIYKISISIAAYISTLNPSNAPFDKYMQGNNSALNAGQVRGFNLFMGKAQCGTCHFAPLFNGLVPPLYLRSELEVIGTPKSDNFEKPRKDDDKGRYEIFPIEFYENAFKTPTVRNSSATAPYMHNGSFSTMEKVIEFYNKGGGNGLGLNIKNQTLSAMPLNLTPNEKKDIISFIGALKDSVY